MGVFIGSCEHCLIFKHLMAEDTLVFSFMQYYCCMKGQYFDLAQFFGQWCSSTRKGKVKKTDPKFADCTNTAWKCCSPMPQMSCCLASGFPVLLYPVITFPQFFLPVFLLPLLWPVAKGSNQDREPTVPDTTQNLVRPSPCPQKQTESEGNQELAETVWLL